MPAVSRSRPKLAPAETLGNEAVPEFVIFPLANGVPAAGRTRIFCQVNLFAVPAGLLLAEIVMVMDDVVTVAEMVPPLATLLMLRVAFASPFNSTVTVALLSNTNPLGAFRIMVPVPIEPPLASW